MDEAINNAEMNSEEMLYKTEKVHCPLETTQTMENRVTDMSMDTDLGITTLSEKTVDFKGNYFLRKICLLQST